MSETRIVGDTLSALNMLAGAYFWRNNTGSFKLSNRWVKFGQKGSGDLIGCYAGRFVAVELKTSRGRQSADQQRWQRLIEQAGGLYVLARSAAETLAALGVGPNHPTRAPRGRVFPR